MLVYILDGLFILSCIILVVTVLLQPGKADAGALFSSGVSSTAFGPRGTQSILAKITIGSAAAFMLFALVLGWPVVNGAKSVLSGAEEPVPAASPAPSPAASIVVPATTGSAAAETATPAASPATGSASPSAKTSPAAKPSPAK